MWLLTMKNWKQESNDFLSKLIVSISFASLFLSLYMLSVVPALVALVLNIVIVLVFIKTTRT